MLKSRWVAVKIPKNHLEIPLFMGKSRLNHVFQSPSDSASGRPGRRKMGALRPDRPAFLNVLRSSIAKREKMAYPLVN